MENLRKKCEKTFKNQGVQPFALYEKIKGINGGINTSKEKRVVHNAQNEHTKIYTYVNWQQQNTMIFLVQEQTVAHKAQHVAQR